MNRIEKLRITYKPTRIACLLIAESPPNSDEPEPRFFYNPNQTKHDHLFRSVMEVVFPDFSSQHDKHSHLNRFCEAGFYLIDATDTPINNLSERERNRIILTGIDDKLREISELISKDTPVFLIKKNIFHLFYPRLRELGYNIVHDEFLPFPSHSQQNKFKDKFRYYLNRIYFQTKR